MISMQKQTFQEAIDEAMKVNCPACGKNVPWFYLQEKTESTYSFKEDEVERKVVCNVCLSVLTTRKKGTLH